MYPVKGTESSLRLWVSARLRAASSHKSYSTMSARQQQTETNVAGYDNRFCISFIVMSRRSVTALPRRSVS